MNVWILDTYIWLQNNWSSLENQVSTRRQCVHWSNTYGSEMWDLNTEVCRKINDANSTMITSITGKTIPQETLASTCNYNVVCVYSQKWLEHILQQCEGCLMLQDLVVQHQMDNQGNLLMDTPSHVTCDRYIYVYINKGTWNRFYIYFVVQNMKHGCS